MDLSVILGMLGAIASISIGDVMEGGNPLHVLHLSSFLIVIPTAMLSAVTATESHLVKAAFKEFKLVFKKLPINFETRIDELIEYAIVVKKQGVLALEKDIQNIDHEFLKEALSMVVDGSKEEQIEENLEPIIEETEHYYHGASHYWLLAGETCPTMGLVGAVLGLILALQKLDDPPAMAAGIAGAFTATVTGIAGSYMFLGPWGLKLKAKGHIIIKEQQLIMAACKGMARGDAPGELKLKLTKMVTAMPLKV
ncbi:flagellar motor stator protein MotA [Aliarcobacter cibarius]|jgi:chemotaxis protein MotA|uniref:Flagellar motor stator protein n=1 Tax=Aliarcobacter cibarius TaxID=255507 RepID=A0A5J6RIG1_9BACT|nr:flagellar motor stator protein MotA [Aliarcobacter cibarius]QEZ89722.1 flagellar motor stator protein [Aliarcobacter cibarius]QKJ27732.1 flagellar motor stator protein [Aliarcobacter cibarius]TLT01113.1 flagellar motor stator protein MotA [Aliarcobacter cibarius]TLT01211.1 flagellar motor stator protein MotA [Aliarcobacter cibarius]TLT05005.1 flagellar motor stator protein MotA [Aliarcobacter cibarius]